MPLNNQTKTAEDVKSIKNKMFDGWTIIEFM